MGILQGPWSDVIPYKSKRWHKETQRMFDEGGRNKGMMFYDMAHRISADFTIAQLRRDHAVMEVL